MSHRSLTRIAAFLALLVIPHQPALFGQESEGETLPLWEVRHDGRTVYLLGSVHLLRPEVYPLDERLYQAFEQADVAAFELDFAEFATGAMAMAQRGMLPADRSLGDILPTDVHAQMLERASALGLPAEIVDRMKPWMASLSLSSLAVQSGGYDVASGIDHHFYERAHAAGKTVIAFETLGQQIDVFDGLSEDQQIAMVRSTLEDLDSTVDMLDRATEAWQRGDTEPLARMFTESMGDQPELLDRLLYQRNRNWIPQIQRLLGGDVDAIVIVGMGHLVGEDSVVAMLEAQGYEVAQQRSRTSRVE